MLLLHLTEQMEEFTITQANASLVPSGGRMLHIHLTVFDGARAQLRIPECFCCETLSRSLKSRLTLQLVKLRGFTFSSF